MSRASLNLRRLASDDDSAFDQVLAIYADVFPSSERKSPVALRAMLEDPDYRFVVAEDDRAVSAFSIVRGLPPTAAVLLEYMGVRKSLQNQGLGSQMFRALVAAEGFAESTFLLEVEDERQPDPARIMAKRKAFYRRLGCLQVAGLQYIMPTVSGDKPPAMNLLVHVASPVTRISRQDLRGWLEAIYVGVYSKSANDARLDVMIRDLSDEVPLI